MDDSPVQETKNVSNFNDIEEIDPLDAYMLEIDEQVHKLDERDKLKVAEEETARKIHEAEKEKEKEKEAGDKEIDDEDDDEEETIGKVGNFSTVEELIA